ncbi:META domain-containing protein [Pseudonocardia sp. EV170527-09]|nr:META domain-containing protein [Pseudonocardia sp. EV170527-09]
MGALQLARSRGGGVRGRLPARLRDRRRAPRRRGRELTAPAGSAIRYTGEVTNRTTALAALAAVLVLSGCGAAGDPGGDPDGAADRDGPRVAAASDLTGVRWLPADGTAQGRAFAEFAPDGTWTGSDGCNGQSGEWTLGGDGALRATAGPSTLIGCENVPVARWVSGAVRVETDGDALLLHPAAGEPVRLVPAPR